MRRVTRRLVEVVRHPVAGNALSLYAVQLAITLIPLLVLPYLARVLGPSELGVVVFVQSFGYLLGLVPEFAFGLSAAREVARNRDDLERVAAVTAGVQGAKVLLTGAAVVLALLAWPIVPDFRARPDLLLLGLALALAGAFHPLWYFIGVERLRLLAVLDVGLRLASAMAIVLVVREAGQGELVLAIYIAGAALSTLVLTTLMYRKVPIRRPSLAASLAALRAGVTLFVSVAAISLYTGSVVFLLGIVTSSAQVAFFAAAERIVRVGIRVLGQVGGATFPRVSYLVGQGREDRADRLALLTLAIVAVVGAVAALGLVVLAPTVVDVFYGDAFGPAVPVLRILALVVPLSVIAATLGGQWLLTRHRDREASRVVIVVGVVAAGAVLVVTPLGGIEAAAWVLVAAEIVAIGGNLLMMRRAGIPLPRLRSSRPALPES